MSASTKHSVDVKDAIRIAKEYVRDLFASDQAKNIGFEEVSSDDEANTWNITVGFSRPWDDVPIPDRHPAMRALNVNFPDDVRRTYKVVIVSASDGKVIRISNRDI